MSAPGDKPTPNAPAWLTQDWLEQILRDDRKNATLTVSSLSIRAAVKKGENYSSDLWRVRANVQRNDNGDDKEAINVIVKVKLSSEYEAAAVIEEMNSFGIEIAAYRNILPRVEQMLKHIYSADDGWQLAPRCLAADETIGYLVFEDLSVRGFDVIDRRFGMDMPHFRLVVDRLAKWHACTVAILDEEPSAAAQFLPAEFEVNSAPWRTIHENQLRTLVAFCRLHPHLATIGAKLETQCTTWYDRVCRDCTVEIDGLRALCHGDLWSNNVLFAAHPQTGALMDAQLIDFQMLFAGSPCLDLLILLHGSSARDVRQDDWDELVQTYHGVYARTLKGCGFAAERIPSLALLHEQMARLTPCLAVMSVLMIGGRNLGGVAEDPVAHYLKDAVEDRQFRLDALLHERCSASVQYLLQYYDRKGVFD